MLSRFSFKYLALAISVSLSMPYTLQAAEAVDVQKTTIQTLQKQFNISLPGARPLLRGTTPNSLSVVKVYKSKKIDHIKLQQTYEGFAVFGGNAVLHQPKSTSRSFNTPKESMNGTVYQGLEKELGKAPPDFVENQQQALEAMKRAYAGKVIKDEEVTPLVYLDEENKAHWAYQVSFLVEHARAIPEKPSAIVDAIDFKPFIQWNDLRTRMPVQAQGFGGNSKMGMLHYDGIEKPLLEISRDSQESNGVVKCFMENKDVKVIDLKKPRIIPMQFPCRFISDDKTLVWTGYQGDGLDEVNGGYSPSNDVLYAGQVIKHMYKDWYGIEVLRNRDDSPMKLLMLVHFEEEKGKDYQNAFWYRGKMVFGDGGEEFYPLVSLGITAHEISHGFTEQNAQFLYRGHTGGMDESFSDMAAQVAEYYATGTNNWTIGGEITKEGSKREVFRYMDMPSKDGISIDNASQYERYMDPHISSGVYNRLFYLISTQDKDWNPKRAFAIMIKANMAYWYGARTFHQAACGVLSAAKELGEPVEGIKQAMDEVRLNYQSCS